MNGVLQEKWVKNQNVSFHEKSLENMTMKIKHPEWYILGKNVILSFDTIHSLQLLLIINPVDQYTIGGCNKNEYYY